MTGAHEEKAKEYTVARVRKVKDPNAPAKPKRKHTWTEKNRDSFYNKCVPARLAALKARKAAKHVQHQSSSSDSPASTNDIKE
jgi:hypothetical protein